MDHVERDLYLRCLELISSAAILVIEPMVEHKTTTPTMIETIRPPLTIATVFILSSQQKQNAAPS
tara:strand:+ start:832 stop:1026 length:195 start_codon:yes stop_codon:yes gene_type:complete